ncbi:MAG: hypothetical protein ABSA83_06725 [Verrucomicrobiota bacterium]
MIVLEANYSKKLGLPGYSSHQFSLTIRKEVSDITQVENESRALFATLQSNVEQRNLILNIVEESKLDKNEVEQLAQDRFGKAVKALNRLEASGLIEELIERTGGKGHQPRFTHSGAR